jgi:CheY-like chemotaxis protein
MSDKRRIVLIDDDQLNNFISTKVIGQISCRRVDSFTRAAEALRHLNACAESSADELPEFIFLDINMPEMDGWQFLEEYEKLPDSVHQQCTVIMLTSSIDVYDIEKSKQYEFIYDFISKPLTVGHLEVLFRQHEKSGRAT